MPTETRIMQKQIHFDNRGVWNVCFTKASQSFSFTSDLVTDSMLTVVTLEGINQNKNKGCVVSARRIGLIG